MKLFVGKDIYFNPNLPGVGDILATLSFSKIKERENFQKLKFNKRTPLK